MNEPTQAELFEMVRDLQHRLGQTERRLEQMEKRLNADIPEDTLMAIAAAVSAYLGNRGTVKAVRFARTDTWASQGRRFQQRHALNV
ncbi:MULTISPECIES: hypothetical protein [Corynebacterium]|uniref:Methylmalonyl-CoA carboxyltransferase 12S subunit n=2 Tax=Corynebacterium glucuronolyticum TaxID=39791 RepID=A0A7T4EF64_9CORY|nr:MULTISPECIES: hypothetical protein [Corynebacterium]EEI28261.1 hypothetical protein HMPREF0294_0025 [Corynebacterium glucuronolyticum ATCC 51867]EEI63378.1 hypothetical protein HMPREF0293_1282 [Corynebacterium glucuronolyticum ATCC 51866]MCT1441985.1 hypothetical protein [Corynebacterium glucuronolyticum]MCT1564370.1 hypothetical protein [Corynebacterium glucuronolyticum]OFO47862.1 hypothetical protein HMPREF3044_09120 [Corynebacterium sp. HMSC073D01]